MRETTTMKTPRPEHPGTDGQEGPTGRVLQTSIPGTEPTKKRKRRSLIEQAVVGDVVVTYATVATTGAPAGIAAMEQVRDEVDGEMIVERWKDQGWNTAKIEVWELRPGGYYRRRRAGR